MNAFSLRASRKNQPSKHVDFRFLVSRAVEKMNHHCCFFFNIEFYLFIFERERENVSRERGTEDPKRALRGARTHEPGRS